MSKTNKKPAAGARANRTRAEILNAAEQLFASRGFAATRLEDVAEEVGVTRAALFYHFKDKQMLFEAMIANAFETLNTDLHDLLDATDKGIAERLRLAAEAWVNAILSRPTLARLIMRFVADGYEQAPRNIFWDDQQLPRKFFDLFQEGRKSGELKPLNSDPFHAASAIVGTTVFYVGALSTLMPTDQFEPLAPEQAAAHKAETLRMLCNLLGIES
ncbi:TetR/AcrR family transcriptional regulator [Litorivivens sp.]|uniref:TetR/AcrR family transcriptional regulator n=1 Tax=Litorivivens sp. TaxID=2020868 RepID=UPI0035689B9A